MDLGLHLTLDDANSKLDPEVIAIADNITPNQAKEFGVVWDLFQTRPEPFQTDEYEILTRGYTAPEVTVTASGAGADWDTTSDTSALPVSSATIDRLTVGDILLVESEIVVVSAVDRVSNNIDVYERGAGDTTAAAHGTSAITAKIIGNAHVEGTADATAMAESTDKVTNYTQLVEEVVDLSHADTEQARKVGRTEQVLKEEAMARIMRDLARTAVYGHAVAPTSSKPSSTRGLLSHLDDVTGAIETAVGGAFTETALQNILDDVREQGGTVNAIVMSVANKRTFNGFTGADASRIQVTGQPQVGGLILDGYLADGFGVIPAVVDIDMPDDKVAVINTNSLGKGWKVGDQLRFEDFTNVNPRENKQLLHGRFGLAVEGVGRTHGLLTSIS